MGRSEGVSTNEEISSGSPPPRGAMAAIFLIILVDFLGFGLIIPLLPFYVPDYEHNGLKVGLIFSIFSICQFIGAPVLGALSDRYGRRPILIISQVGSALGYVLLGIASMPGLGWSPAMRLAMVYASRVIDGFTGGNVSTAQAYISDITSVKDRARGMGLVGAAFGIGFSLGPALGGGLGRLNLSWPAYAAALLALVAALQTWLKLPEVPIKRPAQALNWLSPGTYTPVFRRAVVAPLLWISFISMAAFVMMEATIAVYLAKIFAWHDPKIAAHNTGLFFGFIGLVIIVIQGGLIGRLTRKWGEWPLAIWGPVLVAIGMMMYAGVAWRTTLVVLGLAGVIQAVGRSLQQPTISSLLSKHSDPSEQGLVFGVYHGMSSIARVIGPIVGWLLYPFWNNTGQFWGSATIVTIATVWTISARRAAATNGHPAGEMAHEAVGEANRTEIE